MTRSALIAFRSRWSSAAASSVSPMLISLAASLISIGSSQGLQAEDWPWFLGSRHHRFADALEMLRVRFRPETSDQLGIRFANLRLSSRGWHVQDRTRTNRPARKFIRKMVGHGRAAPFCGFCNASRNSSTSCAGSFASGTPDLGIRVSTSAAPCCAS